MSERPRQTATTTAEMAPGKEGHESLVIKKVYQFVHPDYDSAWSGGGERRHKHLDLQKHWHEAIDKIAEEPESILFYISAFSAREFQVHAKTKKNRKVSLSTLEALSEKMAAKVIERELARILYAKKKLGARFILLTEKGLSREEKLSDDWQEIMKYNFEKTRVRLRALLQRDHITIPPQPIHCFGEYTEWCVKNRGEDLALFLGMVNRDTPWKAKDFVLVMPELSLSYQDPESYYTNPHDQKNRTSA